MTTIDDATLARLHDAYLQAFADLPGPLFSRRRFQWLFTHGSPGQRHEVRVVEEGGEPVACYRLRFPEHDNTHIAWLDPLFVRPDRRGRGLGARLLDEAAGRARANGRSLLFVETPTDGVGARFAVAHGFTVSVAEARRTLDLRTADWAGFRRMLPPVEGYEVELWTGPTAPERLADLGTVMGGMNDAPADASTEHSHFDAERVRAHEESMVPGGLDCYTAMARRVGDGAPAGFTRIFLDADREDGWALQTDTAVLRAHRGHRLGLLLKLANLLRLREREPQLERVVTWNAKSNAHMLAINEAMGFRLLDEWNTWRLPI
ncbi:GNAT family N-acetyltransferase [Nonomuraea sp. SMC257]|uniref:GNAT family N-acetyltransferase n=1 Tax=Nonomuraea montanisoli TaxID=2741721 RepID=A0A7Y6M3K4_9ACTN|nr:GNAT family N-acetyltransferase [Nonomuraea montanisoli]NUW33813.1 GNAT family N-acetyltransferase [Nonomuraea montanisoli]